MKYNKYNPLLLKMLLASLVLLVCASVNVYSQYDEEELGYSMLVQVSPADAGFVTPESGVHRIGINETVALSAVAKPGYRFLYWLGNVADSAANETTTTLDSPRIVIAVFEREEFTLMTASSMPQKSGRGRGGGGAIASGNRFSPKNGSSSPAPIYPPRPPRPTLTWPDQDLFPVPGITLPVPGIFEGGEGEDGEDGLDKLTGDEPIPEPATIALFGLGAFGVLRRKRKKQ